MSVHKDRDRWRVKWRANGKPRSRSFVLKRDAVAFDTKLKRDRSLGIDLARELNRSQVTLDDFVRDGFLSHAALRSAATRRIYAWALTNHLAELVDEPLVALDVPRLMLHQQHLLEHGRTPKTVREVMEALSVILGVAVTHGQIPFNPVRGMTKVPAGPRADIEVLDPEQLERLLDRLDGRDRAIAVLGGHLGLRPIEIRKLMWRNLDGDQLTVPATATKPTAARTRIIDVPRTTSVELKRWQLQAGRPGDREPIVGTFSQNAQRLWNRRVLRPHVDAVGGPPDAVLYTLRHTHASLCHYAGLTPPEAAERLGHDLTLHWKHYAHVIKALRGQRFDGFDALILDARSSAGVPPEFRKREIGGGA